MIRDLGVVQPGTTLYIPFHTYDSNDPSASVTLTGLATSDIEIYKDGSVTQRASDNGYTLLDTDGIDFDGVTGIHGLSINLADNSTAGFYAAGSQYWVVVASVTVDAATVNFVLCTFRIGYPNALFNTTIASLSSQTSFTLTTGPAEDDALNGCVVCIHDVASAVQMGFAVVSDYTGSTKTVTLVAGTTFTAAATDNIAIYPPVSLHQIGGSAVSTSSAQIGVNVVNAGGTAWGSGAITAASIASDAITAAKIAADAVTEITDATKTAFGFVTGAADSGSTTTMVDAALTQADTDYWKGSIIVFTSGTISGQARLITGFTPASDTVTFAPATTQAVGTNTYIILPAGRVDVELWDGSAVNALASGRVDVTVGAMQTDTLTNTALAASAVTEIQAGLSTLDAAGVRSAVGLASANLDTQLGDIPTNSELATAVANVSVDEIQATAIADLFNTNSGTTYASAVAGSAVKEIADNAGGSALTEAGIADAVWDEALSGHTTAGTAGKALSDAGSAGDPWGTALPGAYGAGTAGKIIGDNLNATVSSRASQSSLDTVDDFLDTEIAAIKAKTDNLPTDPADASDIAASFAALPTAATIADAVWDEDATGHQTQGTFGQAIGDPVADSDTIWGLVNTNLNATISSRSSHSAADVWSAGARTLTAGTNIVLAKGTGVTGFNDLSAAQVNAEADTALADYDPPTRAELTSDTNSILSKVLKYFQLLFRKDAGIATDNATEVTAINANGGSGAGAFANTTDAVEAIRDRGDAAWVTATGFSTLDAAGVRTAVGLASANLDTQLGNIVADTAEIGVAGAGLTEAGGTGDHLTAIPSVGSVTGNVGGDVVGDVQGEVASVGTAGISATSLDSAALNAVADAVLDRNMAAGTDSGTNSTSVRTPRQALRALRNKTTIAAGTATVTKEDDSTTSWTASVATTAGDPISGVDPS